ncbi:MAG TPA: hypothetical protein VLB44_01070 [Kofleriaceae bacterium]|nr:hypothetical protein [Kofleriaceae bacterium]
MKRAYVLPVILALATPSVALAQPPADSDNPDDPTGQPLFKVGVATFLVSYGATAGLAAQSFDTDKRWLYIPLAGPWITLATDSPCANCEHDTAWKGLLIADGIVQAAGVTMGITSIVLGGHEHQERHPRLVISPTHIGVFGQF